MNHCPDCYVKPGEPHLEGCDVEHCTQCGRQRLGCDCDGHDPLQALWTGEWPGRSECRANGWYCRRNPNGPGFVPCLATDPEAVLDINRWVEQRITLANN